MEFALFSCPLKEIYAKQFQAPLISTNFKVHLASWQDAEQKIRDAKWRTVKLFHSQALVRGLEGSITVF